MFRKATAADIEAIAAIYEEILDLEEQGRLSTGWVRGLYPCGETIEKALAAQSLYVLEENGEILASGIIDHRQHPVYAKGAWSLPAGPEQVMVLHTLTVRPGARGKGLGRQFVAFYEDLAAGAGCLAARLDTNVINGAARKWYGRLGYREAGVESCQFNGIGGVRLVLFEKALGRKA